MLLQLDGMLEVRERGIQITLNGRGDCRVIDHCSLNRRPFDARCGRVLRLFGSLTRWNLALLSLFLILSER